MQDSLSFALTQISYLVFNINKRNFSQNVRFINKLVQQFGLEADRHYLRCLISSIDFGDVQAAKSSSQAKLLSNELTALLDKPYLISNICYAFDNPINDLKSVKPNIHQLSKTLNFSTIQEVALTVALQHSSTTELAKSAETHLKICLPNLLTSYINLDTSSSSQDLNLNDISPELLQLILSLLSHDKYKQYNITEVVYNKFTEQLCKDFPKDRVPLILAPLLYAENFGLDPDYSNSCDSFLLDSEIMDTSWSNLIVEIGYAFTASVEECKNHLSKVGGRDLAPLDVARLIAIMCRTHTNLSDSSINLPTPSAFWNQTEREKALAASGEHVNWKPDVFVQALKEVAPNLDWKSVCLELDHQEFLIKDRQALNLLLTIFHLGLQLQGNGQATNFPAEALYRHWNNVEGQLSLIATILKNSDLYSFADYIYTSVSIELLKTLPELDNKEVATWKSLYLVDVLLYIGDSGLFGPVLEIFKFPLQHCPDILFMALLQINPPITPLRQELFNQLMPIFLANHPNSGPILHHAWNAPNFNNALKHFIMQAMSDWYVLGEYDQSRLTRILDVAQDLKALSNLLNVRVFMFVIDLACLASRREYLKLDKWLSDKIREHGEPFVQAIAKFLQRRCPQIMGIKVSEDQMPKSQQLPQETLVIMLTCLQAYVSSVTQPELSEAIMTMTTNCSLMLNKNRQVPPPGVIRQRETPFSGSAMNPHLFNAPAVDAIASGLNASMAGLNLSGPAANAFNNYGSAFGNLVTTPASPSRLQGGPSNSPFPMGLTMPGVGNANTLANRLAPTPINDKLSMPSTPGALPEMAQQVSKEVEDEANSYFQRIYNVPPHPTLSIDEVLDMLQRFQESTNRREREVYQCMLRNLFEEYKFFPQYPDKELQITAQLFGGMIERHLVTTYVALGLALRCVLDALKKPEGSKMYYFGITALEKFKTKLHLYQKYCEHVRSLPNFSDFPPDLIQYVEYGYQGQEPPNKPVSGQISMPLSGVGMGGGGTSVTPASIYRSNSAAGSMISTPTTTSKPTPTISQPAVAATRVKSIANATNIDTLLVENKDSFTTPPESVQEKTAFIFNNLSQLNFTAKSEEIKEIMTKDYHQWLSNYIVLKRASIELNFHGLYSNFLDALKIPEVNKMVTKETFRNIKVLLRSDKGIANFSDRSLLKNLGHWLGMLTLARNKPILQIDIDLKSLLVEAYNKGQQELLYTVPFVAKVIESCAKSKVFKPPNPWTMAIMNVLAELHQEPDLKLNLKFEIEVLCKNLNIDVSDLKPGVYLKDPERILNIEYQLSQPSKAKEIGPVVGGSGSGAGVLANLPNSEEQTATTSNITSASPSGIDPATMMLNPPEPRFSVMDINVTSIATVAHLIVYNPNIGLLLSHPQLKAVVRSAIERTINEWISPVVDRSVKIALKTSEQIVRKDFALEPDENRLRSAAHNIVRNLAAGMAMHTCRDQLLQNMQNNIKTLFLANLNPAQKDMIEVAAAQIAGDNTELACVFIQKTAMEKAVLEMDKVLTPDYETRKQARQEGRRYYDGTVLAYQNDRLPETIRLKVGSLTSPQLSVYEEFARNVPGFQPILDRGDPGGGAFMPKIPNFFQDPISAPMPSMAAVTPFNAVPSTMQPYDEISVIYDEIGAKMEAFMSVAINVQQLHMHLQNINALFECLMNARRNRDNTTGMILLKKSVEGLMEGLINIPECVEQIKLYRDIHLRILRLLQDNRSFGSAWTNKAIAKLMIECREENRYNVDAIDLLISSNFVNLQVYDQMLAALIDNGNNYMAIQLAMQLIQMYFIDAPERPEHNVTDNDFLTSIDILVRLAAHPRAPEGLSHLIDMLRSNQDPSSVLVDRAVSGPTSYIHSGMLQARTTDIVDTDGFADKTEHLFRHWVYTYHNDIVRDPVKYFGTFVNRMNFLGVLKGDEQLTKFFTLATKLCIEASYRNLADTTINQSMAKTKTFHWIDAYVRLIALLVRHSGDGSNSNTKLNLLNKVLGIVVGILLQDQEQLHGANFQQFGYQRIFIMLFLELSAHDAILENISVGVVTAFCHTYHMLRPANAPGFCYAWLELISNRVFISRILAMIPQQKGWFMYSQLLIDLFKYLAPFLRNAELAKPVTVLYKGTLRVLLVLLHDFPEFLCDYHFGFCDVIPPNCIQMRNLILSAYPRNMRLPDPFTPNLKVGSLADISTPPRICTNYTAAIQPASFKKDLDSYLKQRAPVTFFAELKRNLQISNEPGSRYNIPLMNALVLYVGTQAIAHIRLKNQGPSKQTVASSAHMDIFQNLAVDSDNEGRYLFLNAIANQLRYPNSHTHYFSCTLLYLFHETNSEAIQEQITRVLLERLIVNRPHPWGLLITFIELIKNPEYEFWKHDFVHCAPEIEKLFESVARSCMVKTNNQQQPPNVENADLAELN